MKVRDGVAADEVKPSLIPTFSLEGRRGHHGSPKGIIESGQ
jgi:hypothetical protein